VSGTEEADAPRRQRTPPAGSPPSDADLLHRHAAGDSDAFGLLFARHQDRLWAVALRTLGDPEEAADALQDAMISAFRRAGGFRGDSAVTTWLHRIVVNACLDRLRRKAARPAASGLDDEAMASLARDARPRDPAADADTALDVTAALGKLPPDQRAALVLVDMLGYPVADAAETLGISVGTVKSRCARGRARLAPRLAHLRGRAEPADTPAGSPPAPRGSGAPPADPAAASPEPGGATGEPGAAVRNHTAPGYVSPAERGGDSRP
jgi:RNA polymerase sigma-70 factor (ECF subfamily)